MVTHVDRETGELLEGHPALEALAREWLRLDAEVRRLTGERDQIRHELLAQQGDAPCVVYGDVAVRRHAALRDELDRELWLDSITELNRQELWAVIEAARGWRRDALPRPLRARYDAATSKSTSAPYITVEVLE